MARNWMGTAAIIVGGVIVGTVGLAAVAVAVAGPGQRAQTIRERGDRLTPDEQAAMGRIEMLLWYGGIDNDHRAVVDAVIAKSRKDGIPINQAFDQVFPITPEQKARMDYQNRARLDELRAMRLE